MRSPSATTMPPPDPLPEQIEFIVAVDRLKQVFRRSRLTDDSRWENDAEHSWHLALMAVVLHEHAAAEVDLCKVLTMHLIHDLVEIDAGDTFAYDEEANVGKEERESAEAERIFGLLPDGQGDSLRRLWEGSRPAAALDRLQPLLLNYHMQPPADRLGAGGRLHRRLHSQHQPRPRPARGFPHGTGEGRLGGAAPHLDGDVLGRRPAPADAPGADRGGGGPRERRDGGVDLGGADRGGSGGWRFVIVDRVTTLRMEAGGRLAGPLQFIDELLQTWQLNPEDAAPLLGLGPAERQCVRDLLTGRAALRGRDIEDRVVHLFRIRKTLSALFLSEESENKWLRETHPALEGETPMQRLLDGSMESLLLVKECVEAAAGR